MNWEIFAIFFSSVLFLLAMLLAKYVYDAVQDFKSGILEIKAQIFNSKPNIKPFENLFVEVIKLNDANSKAIESMFKRQNDLEFYALRPQTMNLYTKDPLLVEQIKPMSARSSKSQALRDQEIKKIVADVVRKIAVPGTPVGSLHDLQPGTLREPKKNASKFNSDTVKTVQSQLKNLE